MESLLKIPQFLAAILIQEPDRLHVHGCRFSGEIQPDDSRFAGANLSEASPLVVRAELARVRRSAGAINAAVSRMRNSRAIRWSRPFSITLDRTMREMERAILESI